MTVTELATETEAFAAWIDKKVTVTLVGSPNEDGERPSFWGKLTAVVAAGIIVDLGYQTTFVPWSSMAYLDLG